MDYSGAWRYLPIFINLVRSDFRRRYLGTYLGAFWAFAAPLSTIGVLLFVFNVGFRSGPVSGAEFDVWLVSGLIVWFFISDGIISGAHSIVEYSFLVKKMQFWVELLPLVRVSSSLYIHLINFAMLVLLLFYRGYKPNVCWLQLPYYFIGLFFFVLGVAMIASVIQVFVKDFQGVVGILMQIGFWGTPVLWDAKMLPAKYGFLVTYNPANYLVQGYRDTFLYNSWFFNRPVEGLYFWGTTACMLVLGLVLFRRTKHEFADVL